MWVLRCLVKFADRGNVFPQYLQPYLSLLGLATPPPDPPSIAFRVFCTGTSRLEMDPAPNCVGAENEELLYSDEDRGN